MAVALSIDTTFLIDLQRERRAGRGDGEAHTFLQERPDAELQLSVVALGEFAEGFPSAEHPTVRAMREHHNVLPIDVETALIYAGITRELRGQGRLIGTNDLWIAATSLRRQLPVVTANAEHFERVEGLQVLTYR